MIPFLFLLAILATAALAPWLGTDSRRLSTDARTDFYPAVPSHSGTLSPLP